MKRNLALFFLFTYFLALLNPISPFINYTLNKQEIIEKFCENKDKPELQCEGKCHLKKQIEKKANSEESEEESSEMEIISPIGRVSTYNIIHLSTFTRKTTSPSFNSKLISCRLGEIEYPPEFL